jgi:uncharacterized protein (TIGR02444 family)
MNPSVTFWDWALAAYERPGVQEALLSLQDEHGQGAVHLLWCAWLSAFGKGASRETLAAGAAMAKAWEAEITDPLRDIRRRVKEQGGEALYARMKATELAAEKVLMERLEGLAADGPEAAPVSLGQALGAAVVRWGTPVPTSAIETLARTLT